MKIVASLLAGITICALPLTAVAQHGGQSHPAPAPHQQAPRSAPSRPAAASHQGFNLPHDVQPSRPGGHPTVQRMPSYQARPPARGRPIGNPHGWSHPWQWNGGIAWAPAPLYWGGGFWGPFAFGLALGAYIVQPETPGYTLLENYGLTQTPCGPPNLVVIYGPDGSEICAYPNNLVAPGEYEVDPTTLTLVSY